MSSSTAVGIASSLVSSCLLHLSKIPGSTPKRKKSGYRASVSEDFSRFKLWANGFDDLPGGLSIDGDAISDPLDKVLEHSKYLKEPTILLLSVFASCLLMKHFRHIGDEHTRNLLENSLQESISIYPHIEDDRCDTVTGQSLKSAAEELHDVVNSLFELAPQLDDILQSLPAIQSRADIGFLPITDSYKSFIRDIFPSAKQHLILRFAGGNAECHKILRGQAEWLPTTGPAPTLSVPIIDKDSGNNPPPAIPSHVQPAPVSDPILGISRPLSPSIDGGHIQSNPFSDSRLDSLGPPERYVHSTTVSDYSFSILRTPSPIHRTSLWPDDEIVPRLDLPSFGDLGGMLRSRVRSSEFQVSTSIISSIPLRPPPSPVLSVSTALSASSFGNKPPIPAMPEQVRPGASFKCTLCHCLQERIYGKWQWREHIFSDIRPYMCIYEGCTETQRSFQSMSEWIDHHNSHGQSGSSLRIEVCPFCLKNLQFDQINRYSHVGYHMETIRLFSLPPSYLQPNDLEPFYSSGTSCSEPTMSSRGSEPSTAENGQKELREKPKAHETPNKKGFIENWLCGGERFGTMTEGNNSSGDVATERVLTEQYEPNATTV